jgi:hypothetical protein
MAEKDDFYSDKEAAKRRDEVIRRMSNTPPRPAHKPKPRHQGTEKLTGQGRAAPKARARGKP